MRGNLQGWRLASLVTVYKSVTPLPALESPQGATVLHERNEVFCVTFLAKVIHCAQRGEREQTISSFNMAIYYMLFSLDEYLCLYR